MEGDPLCRNTSAWTVCASPSPLAAAAAAAAAATRVCLRTVLAGGGGIGIRSSPIVRANEELRSAVQYCPDMAARIDAFGKGSDVISCAKRAFFNLPDVCPEPVGK